MARRITGTGAGTSFDLHQAGDLLRVELTQFGSRESLGVLLSDCLFDQIGPQPAAREVLEIEVSRRPPIRKANLIAPAIGNDLVLDESDLLDHVADHFSFAWSRRAGRKVELPPALTPTKANQRIHQWLEPI